MSLENVNGVTDFTYQEVRKTKKELLPGYDVDYLFEDDKKEEVISGGESTTPLNYR